MRTTNSVAISCVVLTLSLTAAVPENASAERAEAIIIDHTCTVLQDIPEEWIVAAKDQLRLCYGHTSHGSQPITGMQVLMDDPTHLGLYDFNYDGAVEPGVLSLADEVPDDTDLGSPDRTTWAARTRSHLDGPGSDRNVVIWSWCGQADTSAENIDLYLGLMDDLEQDYPDVVFVYMTGHLNGTGEEGNLFQRNNQIRDFCVVNDKVLFDFADIESYDPDWDYFRDLYADDECNYSGGNWAVEWCAQNPGSPLCYDCDCSHSRPLNCNLKGKAFWWMLARIAGWQSEGSSTVACDLACRPAVGTLPFPVRFTTILTNNCLDFSRRYAGQVNVIMPEGKIITGWRAWRVRLDPGEIRINRWVQVLPDRPYLVGQSTFTFKAVDITPAPFNQPPYPPSDQTDSASCSVTGVAP